MHVFHMSHIIIGTLKVQKYRPTLKELHTGDTYRDYVFDMNFLKSITIQHIQSVKFIPKNSLRRNVFLIALYDYLIYAPLILLELSQVSVESEAMFKFTENKSLITEIIELVLYLER